MLKKLFYSSLAVAPVVMFAETTATLPEVGQGSFTGFLVQAFAMVAIVISSVVAGFVAFQVCRYALRWFKMMF